LNDTKKTVKITPDTGPTRAELDSGKDSVYSEYSDRAQIPGKGSNSTIYFNRKFTNYVDLFGSDEDEEWAKNTPPGINLAHELIHSYQAATGTQRDGDTQNDNRRSPIDRRVMRAPIKEVQVTGVPGTPYEDGKSQACPFTENKIRKEWRPRELPVRKYY
jgi:hypothetical protein